MNDWFSALQNQNVKGWLNDTFSRNGFLSTPPYTSTLSSTALNGSPVHTIISGSPVHGTRAVHNGPTGHLNGYMNDHVHTNGYINGSGLTNGYVNSNGSLLSSGPPYTNGHLNSNGSIPHGHLYINDTTYNNVNVQSNGPLSNGSPVHRNGQIYNGRSYVNTSPYHVNQPSQPAGSNINQGPVQINPVSSFSSPLSSPYKTGAAGSSSPAPSKGRGSSTAVIHPFSPHYSLPRSLNINFINNKDIGQLQLFQIFFGNKNYFVFLVSTTLKGVIDRLTTFFNYS